MVSSPVAADDKRNLYSPEPFLFDIDFDPNLHNLNSPSTSDVIGKYTAGRGVSEKVVAVSFCLGSDLFGSYNSD